jgi:hypothetical protein
MNSISSTGLIIIPPLSTIMLVYNGNKWTDIEALRAPMQVSLKKF